MSQAVEDEFARIIVLSGRMASLKLFSEFAMFWVCKCSRREGEPHVVKSCHCRPSSIPSSQLRCISALLEASLDTFAGRVYGSRRIFGVCRVFGKFVDIYLALFTTSVLGKNTHSCTVDLVHGPPSMEKEIHGRRDLHSIVYRRKSFYES